MVNSGLSPVLPAPGVSMKLLMLATIAVFSSSFAMAQVTPTAVLPPKTTLPISFSHGIDANHAHVGDLVSAKTTQPINLANGQILSAGAVVTGHVVQADAFAFDSTPYAKQRQSALAIHFDFVVSKGTHLPLNVYVRALATPLSSWDARRPKPSDEDPLGTLTQIGGDLVTPSLDKVMSQDGDIVGYKRHGDVYAHLISASGNAPGGCDASDNEQSMGLFSASACGLYGFADTNLVETGKTGELSTLILISQRHSPKIWANSTALLEVLSQSPAIVSQLSTPVP
jgi:hypothetical protein